MSELGTLSEDEFRRHLDQCSAMVSTWPVWKRNILEQSASPIVPIARTPVDNDPDIPKMTKEEFHAIVSPRPTEKEAQSVGDPQYLALLDELRQMHLNKAADYGSGEEPLANLKQSTNLGIAPWIGCILRLSDKLFRIHSLIRNGKLVNESIDDNLKDMASYALLALRLLREKSE